MLLSKQTLYSVSLDIQKSTHSPYSPPCSLFGSYLKHRPPQQTEICLEPSSKQTSLASLLLLSHGERCQQQKQQRESQQQQQQPESQQQQQQPESQQQQQRQRLQQQQRQPQQQLLHRAAVGLIHLNEEPVSYRSPLLLAAANGNSSSSRADPPQPATST
ncbi:hypothetical protein Esti_003027 [Eimeria stiedai]